MAITNQERLGKAMDLLRAGLAPFVEREVQSAVKAGSLRMEAVRRFAEDPNLGQKPIAQWDVAGLLKLTWEIWNDVFGRILGRAERSLVQELRDWRNKWAHQEPLSSDDTDRALDSMSRLLSAVSAPQADDVTRMKMELRRLTFDEQVRGTMAAMQATLNALAAFPAELEKHYAAFPPGYVNWAPPSWDGVPSEAFTAIEQICHVRDIEIDGYQVRFRRTLDEAAPFLPSVDSERLALERDYAHADPARVFAEFRAARTATLALLRGVSAEDWRRPADFDGYGPVTLLGLVHFLCSHDQQHLAGLQWLLGKIDAASQAA